MSENGKNLSDYISFMSSHLQMHSVIAGFMFTAITLLVTLLPDPSQLAAQATLLSLSIIFGLSLNKIIDADITLGYCVRVAPPLPDGFIKRSNFIDRTFYFVLAFPIVFMFLLWNLTYLALAAIVGDALLIIFGYFHRKPVGYTMTRFEAQTKKSWRIRKFFDERDIIFESED